MDGREGDNPTKYDDLAAKLGKSAVACRIQMHKLKMCGALEHRRVSSTPAPAMLSSSKNPFYPKSLC